MDKNKLDEILTCRDISLKQFEAIQTTVEGDLYSVLQAVVSKNKECFNKIKNFDVGDYPHIRTALEKTSTRISLETGIMNSFLTTLDGKQVLNKVELKDELLSRMMFVEVARTHEKKFWTVAETAIGKHEERKANTVESSYDLLIWVVCFFGFIGISKLLHSFFNKKKQNEKNEE